MTREEIRREVRKKRKGLSGIQALEMSLRICEKVVTMPEYVAAKRVMCYSSLPEEVQTSSLIWAIRRSGRQLFLPAVTEDGLLAVRVHEDTAMFRDKLGIETPRGEPEPPENIDLVLVPGIAFDRAGSRLGFGRGYYDRFLAQCACPFIALAFDLQVVPDSPRAEHDVAMHKIVTEKGVYDCSQADI